MPPPTPTIIIGLSGPSSSGKTTLARLLHRIFTLPPDASTPAPPPQIRSLLIHEDDFYHPDDKIPLTTLPTGTVLQNWDTAGALDLGFLAASLEYVRTHGRLPPRLRSKEDQNDTQPVDDDTSASTGAAGEGQGQEQVVEALRRRVQQRLGADAGTKTVAFMEGFLLFAPPCDTAAAAAAQHPLREVHERMDGRLFLPAAYEKVKERRERRSGYVTIGAAPVPEGAAAEGEQQGNGSGDAVKDDRESIDLEAEDDRPPQNFWTDPPGYVDDIVWPNYVKDHAWLLLPERETEDEDRLLRESDPQVLVRLVGQGTRLRENAGVTVAPGRGDKPITELLTWAVEEVLKHLEKTV